MIHLYALALEHSRQKRQLCLNAEHDLKTEHIQEQRLSQSWHEEKLHRLCTGVKVCLFQIDSCTKNISFLEI